MTEAQAASIRELRMKGVGYRTIGSLLGLSRDIVRNYCKSKGLDGYGAATKLNIKEQIESGYACAFCGASIVQPAIGRKKKFCSDSCRREWWKAHPEAMNKNVKAVYHMTCNHCGSKFDSYGNQSRKYCCHDCYIKERFWRNAEYGV